MISGVSKKIVFSYLLFFNFLQTSNSVEFRNFNRNIDNKITKLSGSKILNNKISSNSKKLFLDNNFEKISSQEKTINNPDFLLSENSSSQQELVIQSDEQSEINDIINAKGNVSVSYKGKFLKADNLIYDKLNKKISAEGNITLILGDQIFKASKLEYNFLSEKGYLLNVKGSIKSNTLLYDLSSNFSLQDSKNIENLLELKKKEVINTPGKVENWLFFSDKIIIDGEKWKSKKAVFSNDLLDLKQVKLEINSLEVIPDDEKLRFRSSLNYLILEEKVSIPFWLGGRTFSIDNTKLDNRWNFEYENLDKDGFFISRKFDSIDISDNFVLDLEPQFLIQRSLKGYTKSFVEKGDSITSEKVKRNISFADYFALKSKIKGYINNWDLEIDKNLNSFDFDKFSDAFRLKTKLSKEFKFLSISKSQLFILPFI